MSLPVCSLSGKLYAEISDGGPDESANCHASEIILVVGMYRYTAVDVQSAAMGLI